MHTHGGGTGLAGVPSLFTPLRPGNAALVTPALTACYPHPLPQLL